MPSTKIINGRHGFIREVPYTVSIHLFLRHICGGTIISPQHVLTSACCVTIPGTGIYSIIAGSTLIRGSFDAGHNHRVVARIAMHPEYNARTLQNDIAVLTLRARLATNQHTIVIAGLPPPNVAILPNMIGDISGW